MSYGITELMNKLKNFIKISSRIFVLLIFFFFNNITGNTKTKINKKETFASFYK
jgi:hypothetical protein